MIDHQANLPLGKLVAERGHHAVERARRTALVHDGQPVEIGFGSGKAAVGEIRRLNLEAANRDGLAAPVAPVTRSARRLIQLLPVERGPIDRLRIERNVEHEKRDDRGDDGHRPATVAREFRSPET